MLKLFLFLLFTSLVVPIQAQQVPKKKELTETDYSLWETIHPIALSGNGRWVSYYKKDSSGKSTLYLFNTLLNSTRVFPEAKDAKFLWDSGLGFIFKGRDFRLVDLTTGKVNSIQDVARFVYSKDAKILVTIGEGNGNKRKLRFYNSTGGLIDSVNNVIDFWLSPDGRTIVWEKVWDENRIMAVSDLLTMSRDTILIDQSCDRKLVWQKNSQAVAFYSTDTSKSLSAVYYNLKDKLIKTCTAEKLSKEGNQLEISANRGLHISDDGDRLFFGVKPMHVIVSAQDTSGVEVWRAWDHETYHQTALSVKDGGVNMIGSWDTRSQRFKKVTTDSLPMVQFSAGQEFSLTSRESWRASYVKLFDAVNFKLTSQQTGDSHLFLRQQSGNPNDVKFSPLSQHLAYYRDHNWWLYDLNGNLKRNLTDGIKVKWDEGGDPKTYKTDPYGIAGWTADGKGILLYDEFDLWYFSFDGTSKHKITNGADSNIIFRINTVEYENFPIENFDGYGSAIFDFKKDIILDAHGKADHKSGFYILTGLNEIKKLIYTNAMIRNIRGNGNGQFIYTIEKFDQSPVIHYIDAGLRDMEVARSNTHQVDYWWGKSELVGYKDKLGRRLQGALFYPANYNPDKKYPMIVHIYQSLSSSLHEYVNPGLSNSDGFNVTNLTLKGYFVLMPDIAYVKNDPGVSAHDCVEAAVRAVISKGIVDKTAIGLDGHSFGGYETGIILTRSKLFSAAVAGAGIFDFVNSYFSMDQWGQQEMWRYEDHQMRMKGTFFKNKKQYLVNSPLHNADKITTPLLSWTGKNDPVVSPTQSLYLFAALRRLNREHVMLVYPGEDHALIIEKNQQHLTRSLEAWFDQYLKGEPPAKWIAKEVGIGK